MVYEPKEPTDATAEANRAALARQAMDDRADFEDIERGLIARIGKTLTADGEVVFDFATVQDMAPGQERPDSVNPSLWRQSQLNSVGGLFKVTDGLYQARGSGAANLTIVDGPEGLVIIDCTASTDSARQGLELFREHVSDLHPHPLRSLRRRQGCHRPGRRGLRQGPDYRAGHDRLVRQAGEVAGIAGAGAAERLQAAQHPRHPRLGDRASACGQAAARANHTAASTSATAAAGSWSLAKGPARPWRITAPTARPG